MSKVVKFSGQMDAKIKRAAWTATKTFLLVNGQHLKVSADEAEDFLVQRLIKSKVDLTVIRKWLKERSGPNFDE